MAILDAAPYAVGSLAVNSLLQRQTAERNQQYYRENMHANYLISQQAQRNAARNEVEGLRAAGLNPALADGAAGAPQVSAQGGTEQAAQFDPANLLLRGQLKLQQAQLENIKADTNKKDVEAGKIGSETQLNSEQLAQYKEYRQAYSLNLQRMYREFAKDDYHFDKSSREAFEFAAEELEKDSSEGVSAGGQKAIFDYLETRQKLLSQVSKEVAASFDFEIALAKMDDKIIKATAEMPLAQKNNLLSLSAQYMENVKLMATQEDLNVKDLEKLEKDINKIVVETKKLYHSDNLQLIDDKQAGKLLWNVGSSAASALLRAKH